MHPGRGDEAEHRGCKIEIFGNGTPKHTVWIGYDISTCRRQAKNGPPPHCAVLAIECLTLETMFTALAVAERKGHRGSWHPSCGPGSR